MSSKPKRAVQIVLALAIALIVTLAGMIIIVFDLGTSSETPPESMYPSEVTPLSIVDGGIKWTRSFNLTIGEIGLEYSKFLCGWCYRINNSGGTYSGHLVSDEDQVELSKNSSAVVQTDFGESSPWFDAPSLIVSFSIHDVMGDGIFGFGDFIVMDDAPRTEGIIYSWALAYVYGVTINVEYSYAFQDGVFYTWQSNELPTEGVWWDP